MSLTDDFNEKGGVRLAWRHNAPARRFLRGVVGGVAVMAFLATGPGSPLMKSNFQPGMSFDERVAQHYHENYCRTGAWDHEIPEDIIPFIEAMLAHEGYKRDGTGAKDIEVQKAAYLQQQQERQPIPVCPCPPQLSHAALLRRREGEGDASSENQNDKEPPTSDPSGCCV